MQSNSRLGTVYEEAKNLGSAIAFHESHRELAIAQDNKKEILKANAELVKVRRVRGCLGARELKGRYYAGRWAAGASTC